MPFVCTLYVQPIKHLFGANVFTEHQGCHLHPPAGGSRTKDNDGGFHHGQHFARLRTRPTSSSSNWILMSCQPHRVTSGKSNSGHKQIHILKLFSHIYQPSVKSVYKTNQFANIKQTSDTNFRRVSPFSITPVKSAHKARTCWYRRPFRLIYRYQVKEKYKKRNGHTI